MDRHEALVLDDDEDLRDALANIISRATNCNVLSLASVDELMREMASVLTTKIAFLDINLGPSKPSGLNAYACLVDHGYTGKIFFFTGHARSHPLVVMAQRLGRAEILIKPIEVSKLVEFVRREISKDCE